MSVSHRAARRVLVIDSACYSPRGTRGSCFNFLKSFSLGDSGASKPGGLMGSSFGNLTCDAIPFLLDRYESREAFFKMVAARKLHSPQNEHYIPSRGCSNRRAAVFGPDRMSRASFESLLKQFHHLSPSIQLYHRPSGC